MRKQFTLFYLLVVVTLFTQHSGLIAKKEKMATAYTRSIDAEIPKKVAEEENVDEEIPLKRQKHLWMIVMALFVLQVLQELCVSIGSIEV